MSRAERDKHLEHEGYETWDPNCRRCIEWGPVSDNAETREALAEAILARWEDPDTIEASTRGLALLAAAAVLAALPPVAGPEVRPDETLRAKVEACLPVDCDPGIRWSGEPYREAAEKVGGRSEWAMRFLSCLSALRHERQQHDRLYSSVVAALASPAPAATEVGEGER